MLNYCCSVGDKNGAYNQYWNLQVAINISGGLMVLISVELSTVLSESIPQYARWIKSTQTGSKLYNRGSTPTNDN